MRYDKSKYIFIYSFVKEVPFFLSSYILHSNISNFRNYFHRAFITKKQILYKLTAIIILGLFFNSSDVRSQYRDNITFEYLTADNGLSDNRIYSIYRDSKDYLWFGTNNNGLNKYDGNNITIYKHIDDRPGSISNNGIRYIYEDNKNNLWIGTTDGLNLYDPKSESFVVFRHDSVDKSGHCSNFVTGIIEGEKSNLWVTYDEGAGLAKWDYEKGNFICYRIKDQNNDYDANSMTSIKKDSKGGLWIATRGPSIYRFDPGTGDFTAYNDPAIDFGKGLEKRLCIDRNDKLWIGSFGNGLYSFDPVMGKFKHFGIHVGNKGINNHLVLDIIQTDDHHLLIGTDQGGINSYNMASNTFEYIVKNEKIAHGLNNNGILSLCQDKEGILWVGTSRGGVNYFNPKEHNFKLFVHENNPNSLSYNVVGCFYEDSEGLIWIGTDGGGLNVYDPKTGNFTIYKHDPSDPYSVSGDVIRCIAEDKKGDMWIGTWDAGLDQYNKKQGRFHHYFHDKTDTSSISSNSIWHLIVDHNDNIWLCSYLQGVEIFNKKKGVVKRFKANQDNPHSLSTNNCLLIHEDQQRNIWICSHDGLNLYDSITNSFTVYKNFPDNNIFAFCKDSEGKLWAGSPNKGIFLFDQDGTIVKIYNNKNGLPDNMVHAIVEDNHGDLWISTSKGISHFNQKTMKFRNYFKNDGLQGNIFFLQSFLKTRSGEIYFGGYNGFNSFYPDSLKDNNYIPKVYITAFKLFNKPVPFGVPGSPLQNCISETKEITLSWRESVFSFEYIATNYTFPEQNQYAYIMEGFEKEWNYVGDIKSATYTNMDAGEYTFRVKASNNDGIWNEEGTSIKIVITPPFWETWWFKLIIGLIIATMLLAAYLIRVSSLKKQKIILKNQVESRTIELKKAYDNLSNISEFGQKINSSLDFNTINEMIYRYIKSFLDTFGFGIGVYSPKKELIEYRMYYEDGKPVHSYTYQVSNKNNFSVYCLEKQVTVLINDFETEYKKYFPELPDFSTSGYLSSLINIPLTVKKKKIGLLTITSIKKNAFNKRDLLKLQTLAAYIAIALDNAESHAALREKNELLIENHKKIKEQRDLLNKNNTILKERQHRIEEQSEELRAQTEILFIANEDLKKSNATKDKLFSIIAHDLKNPFNSILGFTNLISTRWDQIETGKKKLMVESVHNSARNIYKLLENLLLWSRSQMDNIKFTPENILLYDLVRDNINLFSNLIEQKNISVKLNIPNDLFCYADNEMIKTVIRNLLNNAIKFTEEGTIIFSSEIDNDVVKVSIRDTGVGIEEDKLNNLFEVKQSKSTSGTRGEEGTGLGLIICKEFILKNNGHIYATSKINKGTTVAFTLPLKANKN
jgi:ligand-binding sensor domain-containing protein/signal transduction histidine kinase